MDSENQDTVVDPTQNGNGGPVAEDGLVKLRDATLNELEIVDARLMQLEKANKMNSISSVILSCAVIGLLLLSKKGTPPSV